LCFILIAGKCCNDCLTIAVFVEEVDSSDNFSGGTHVDTPTHPMIPVLKEITEQKQVWVKMAGSSSGMVNTSFSILLHFKCWLVDITAAQEDCERGGFEVPSHPKPGSGSAWKRI
jgi:hypothetical protein